MLDIVELILPIFAVVALGWGLARFGFVDEAGERGLNALVYWITTPALLFRTMATMRPPGIADAGLLGAYFAAALAVYAIALAGARAAGKPALDWRAVAAMGVTFSNSVLMGIPIVERAYGAEGLVLLTLIISIHGAVFIGLSTMLIEVSRGAARPAETLRTTVLAVVKNPFLAAIAAGLAADLAGLRLPTVIDRTLAMVGAATAAGLAADLAGLRLPTVIDRTLAMVGAATVPVALVTVGAGLARIRLAGALGPGAAIAAAKLLLMPAAVWLAARHVFALPPLAVAVAVTSAALPSGINAFILARRYEVALAETTAAIVLSTIAAPVTLAAGMGRRRP